MLTVWGRASSSNVQAVMWCAAELGLDVERIDAGLSYGVTDTADYLAMNPNGTVPTVREDGGPAIFESAAIIRLLAARHGDERFWPSDPVARAPIDQWAEWAKQNVALRFTAPVFWQVVRIPAARRDPEAIRRGLGQLHRTLAIADARLGRQAHLAGENFTVADILFGHVLHRYFGIAIERAPLGSLRRYYERLGERPAYAEHVMVSWEELVDTL